MEKRSLKILHVLPSLGMGGAERLASELAARAPSDIEHVFVSMVSGPPFFSMSGARVLTLGLARGQFSLKALRAFRALVRAEAPDVVQGWLYHGNILVSLARDLGPAILWSVHNTSLDRRGSKILTRVLNRIAAMISSRVPDKIVYCAEEARRFHEGLGYDRQKGVVISNGVDLEHFAPSAPRRQAQRQALGVLEQDFLCGQLGRLDAQKGLPVLLSAFQVVRDRLPQAWLILAGSGFEMSDSEPDRHLLLMPARHDIRELLAAIDVLIIASTFGEALPIIALEAAATGLPIVTTTVGEAKRLVLSPEHVVAPGNAEALAHAVCKVHRELALSALTQAVIRRDALLGESFEIGLTVETYAQLYRSIAADRI